MGSIELAQKVTELRELRRMAAELDAEIEALQNTIKAVMSAQGIDTIKNASRQSWACECHNDAGCLFPCNRANEEDQLRTDGQLYQGCCWSPKGKLKGNNKQTQRSNV